MLIVVVSAAPLFILSGSFLANFTDQQISFSHAIYTASRSRMTVRARRGSCQNLNRGVNQSAEIIHNILRHRPIQALHVKFWAWRKAPAARCVLRPKRLFFHQP